MGMINQDLLLMRRMTMGMGIPYNQVWYKADEQITLYSQTGVIDHSFSNGLGKLSFNTNVLLVDNWFRGTNVKNVFLPGSASIISNSAFLNCVALENISMPDGVTLIRLSAFEGCTSLSLRTLPKGLTSIGTSAFKNCINLTISEFPVGLSDINGSVFEGCANIAIDSINDGISVIGSAAFKDCVSISTLSLPNSLTEIKMNGFNGCTGLQSVTIPAEVPPTLNLGSFDRTSCLFYVPASAVDAYKAAARWSNYASRIFAIPE